MDQTMKTTVLRQTNRRRVYQYIYESVQPVTRQKIAGELSLDLPTVSDNLAELLEEGLVSCSGAQDSTGGHEPHAYTLEPRARVAVGISVKDDGVQMLVIDMRVEELCCRELELPFSHTPEYYQTVAQALEEFLDGAGIQRNRLLGVGITLPGIINREENRLVMAPTLELWDIPLEEIYCHFSQYPAFIENDANASGYAELWADTERSNMVYLFLDREVGGAVLMGDKQYMGDHGRSAEFGHMCVVPNGQLCHCGRRGCMEVYCSISRLSDDLGLTLEEFFGQLQAGNEQAAAIWEEYRDHLTDALAILHTSFDCDIVLGGALSFYLAPYLPELSWELGEKTLFDGGGSSLCLDHFGPHSACTGTALRFIDDFLLTF